jgi:hypothetical protein
MEKTRTLPQRLSRTLRLLLLFILVAPWVSYTYFFLHETGHAIAVVTFGGKLTEFRVGLWNSHYRFSGQLSSVENSIRVSAGIVFPLIVWWLLILAVPRKTSLFFGIIRVFISLSFLATLLPCIVKSVLYQHGWRSYNGWGDDVTSFLDYSRWNGYITAGIVLIVLAVGVVLLRYKARVGETIGEIRREPSFRVDVRLILVLIVIWVMEVVTTMIINRSG